MAALLNFAFDPDRTLRTTCVVLMLAVVFGSWVADFIGGMP